VTRKIKGLSWYWTFLVSKRIQGPPILGVDFIYRTNLVLELGSERCYFRFAPVVYFSLIRGISRFAISRTLPPLYAFTLYTEWQVIQLSEREVGTVNP
jgi:hypothetical protein